MFICLESIEFGGNLNLLYVFVVFWMKFKESILEILFKDL